MQIKITKKGDRNTLSCIRQDGTFTSQDLGPDFPHHDMAHFVVESHFKLHNGFYGLIQQGRTIDELNDKEVIKTLGAEAILAEILTRNLQAVSSGSVVAADYGEVVKWELEQIDGIEMPAVSEKNVLKMKTELEQLVAKWQALPEQESLILDFVI